MVEDLNEGGVGRRPKLGEVFNGEKRQVEREKFGEVFHLFTDLIQHKTKINGKVLPQGL